ncbi:condensin-2 complex subunit D3-like [Histomonas meleagridis]|uniref:condensin-2 complex subunit D3-like n=1 Tax=Histomonas meleagridis TaxID=135588 RepID=UPI00355A1FFF|nr:condensin-2 complex subunit D3-like [Histomonas meleagridis]KAH0797068.1 condensin-2 complex subunit D3-like [Histomonas meleagridis]
MTNSFADESPIVQHQTLHVITRLVVEDFLKLKPLLFFKYVYAITDVHNEVALFAQSCLSVILEKFPKIISDSFIDTIYYFSGCIDLPLLGETNEEKRIFKINSTKRRQLALSLLISKLNEVSTYTLIQALFTQVLERYVKEELDVFKHGVVLEDVIHSLNELEDKMKQSTEVEVINDDPVSDSVFEASKRIMIDIHNKIIQTMLPTLNELHRLLRNLHSPCQKKLKEFYQKICLKHPNLLSQLEKSEPILAVELKNEMESIEEEEVDQQKTPPTTPKKDMPYTSPLLSKIATTPRSLLSSPKSQKIALLATPPRSKRQMEFSTPKHANDLD